jgi:hypothetical protein
MNPLRVLPLLLLLLIGSAHAQSSTPAGRPCSITNHMKGTCFYNAAGELSHWIVRSWDFGGGPGSLAEVVGYPAFLKEQEGYNRWIKSTPPIPGLQIDILTPLTPAENELVRQQDEKSMAEVRALGAPTWDTLINGGTFRHDLPSAHGWETGSQGMKRILVPSDIEETGALNLDTLRIPMFITAGKILAARERLKNDCSSASDLYYEWSESQPVPSYPDLRAGGFCGLNDLPQNAGFADWKRLLDARARSLSLAETSSRRFDDLVGGLQHTIIQYITQSFTPDKLPAGMADQLLKLQAESEAELRVADSLENKSAPVSERYRRTTEQLFQRHEAALNKEACERVNKEMHQKYDKEWIEKYGQPFPVEPCK